MTYKIIDDTKCECGGEYILPEKYNVYYSYPLQADVVCNKCNSKKLLHIDKKNH